MQMHFAGAGLDLRAAGDLSDIETAERRGVGEIAVDKRRLNQTEQRRRTGNDSFADEHAHIARFVDVRAFAQHDHTAEHRRRRDRRTTRVVDAAAECRAAEMSVDRKVRLELAGNRLRDPAEIRIIRHDQRDLTIHGRELRVRLRTSIRIEGDVSRARRRRSCFSP